MTIFKKIVNKEIPAYTIYEDDLVLAFLDISQTTKGHTLVITKEVYENIFDVPEELFMHLMHVVQKVTKAIKKAYSPLGINLVNNNGAKAGQTVFHYHFHIIPRYENDKFEITFENNMANLNADDYKKRAELIKAALL